MEVKKLLGRSVIMVKLFRESVVFAFSQLRGDKFRTFLSLFGVSVGIFTIWDLVENGTMYLSADTMSSLFKDIEFQFDKLKNKMNGRIEAYDKLSGEYNK